MEKKQCPLHNVEMECKNDCNYCMKTFKEMKARDSVNAYWKYHEITVKEVKRVIEENKELRYNSNNFNSVLNEYGDAVVRNLIGYNVNLEIANQAIEENDNLKREKYSKQAQINFDWLMELL